MARLADEALNLPLDPEDDSPELEVVEVPEPDLDALYAAHMNPLGLTAGDLVAVGWNSDATGEGWFHEQHGACSFLVACRREYEKLNPTPEDF